MRDYLHLVELWFLLGFSLIVLCQARTYIIGNECSVFLKDIDEDDIIYVNYNGGPISLCDHVSFNGRGDEILDDYKVCVTPEFYEDPDCAIELVYTKTLGGDPIQTYTCSNPPKSEFCGESGDFFYITLKSKSNYRDNAKFSLKVTSIRTYDAVLTIGIILGSVFAGLFVMAIIVGVIIFCVCRRKRSSGQVLNPTPVPMATYNQPTTGYPTQAYGVNQPAVSPQQFGSYPTQHTGSYPTQVTGSYPTQPTDSNTGSAPGFTYNEPPSNDQMTSSDQIKM